MDLSAEEAGRMTSETKPQKSKVEPMTDVSVPYAPKPHELEAMKTYVAKGDRAPRLTVTKSAGGTSIGIDHPKPLVGNVTLMHALGTQDTRFLNGILLQLGNAIGKGQDVDEGDLNFMAAMVTGVQPRDQIETMLALQMAATHNAIMTFARQLNNANTIPQQDSAERAFNKLARTFTSQIEALKRYRSTGEQRVTVERVTINEGGQAIVGNVTHAPGGGRMIKKDETTS